MAQLGNTDIYGNLSVTGTTTSNGNFIGNLTGTASKATGDSAGQQITTTYIKGLSVSGKTITYTKGDNSTGTITTQDTTYSSKSAASGGTDVSLVTTGEKHTWNSKANGSHTHNYAGSASAGGPANDFVAVLQVMMRIDTFILHIMIPLTITLLLALLLREGL